MPRSTASTVDDYLGELPEDRRPVVTQLRELCRDTLTGFREAMAYGMPVYERDGTAEIAFASQKHYISFYLMRSDLRETFAEHLDTKDMGKGCLRFRKPEAVDFDLLRTILEATAASRGTIC
ncbi:iron chaperone [Nocardia sp. NPDC004151]|uniref:iron chaperone n=1 Tax=Nocardia sp. NPDC004151 TaxID=3364304 RepID=UPI0036B74003